MLQKERKEYSRSVGCPTTNCAMIVCKNKDKKYLSFKDRIPSFYLGHNDQYKQFKTANKKFFDDDISSMAICIKKQCGVNIAIRGILRIEHTENDAKSANMRVIYYAESLSEGFMNMTKDSKWIDIPSKANIANKMKDSDLFSWINYLEYGNGIIYPLNIFTSESAEVEDPNYQVQHIRYHNSNFSAIIYNKNNSADESKENDEQQPQ